MYTNYMERNRDFTTTEFEDIRADIATLIDVATGLGVRLQGYVPYQPVVLDTDVIAFDGVDDQSHVVFMLTREITKNDYNPTLTFCKTSRCNYDPVVAAAMMVVKQRVPEDVRVSSDGSWDREWLHGTQCYSDSNHPTCKNTDPGHARLSGRSLYRLAFPDSQSRVTPLSPRS